MDLFMINPIKFAKSSTSFSDKFNVMHVVAICLHNSVPLNACICASHCLEKLRIRIHALKYLKERLLLLGMPNTYGFFQELLRPFDASKLIQYIELILYLKLQALCGLISHELRISHIYRQSVYKNYRIIKFYFKLHTNIYFAYTLRTKQFTPVVSLFLMIYINLNKLCLHEH